MQQAVATSAACGLPIAIAGAISFMVVGMDAPHLPAWSVGYVYLPAVVGIALTSMFFARFGATLAHRLSPLMLKRLFAVLLVCVGTNFLI
ncbi:Sulfite exporter TauE/SafE [compost metagenome]